MALNKATNRGVLGVPECHGTSINDFDKWVKLVSAQTTKSIFRGQRRYWPLLPRVIQGCKRGTVLSHENRLFKQFKADGAKCLHNVPDTDWDWLVVAQHHGLPTRLLDWSFDPYVALWFALEKHPKPGSHPEVWVLNPKNDDYVIPQKGMRPFQGTRTKVFKPTFEIPRVREQKGCFTLFKYVKKNEMQFVPLERNIKLRNRLQRFRVTSFRCGKIQKWLEKNGYTHERMYPDIDKLAKRIRNAFMTLTFGLSTIHDLFAKLQRDADALDEEVTSDRFFNFVVTGYSIIDWVKNDPIVPAAAKTAVSVQDLYNDKWLKVCGDLATASKHFKLTRRVPVTSSATTSQGYGVARYGKGGYGVGEESIEVQLNDGTTFHCIELVQGVLTSWQTFFAAHGK